MKRDRFLLLGALIQFALLALLTRWTREHRLSLRDILVSRYMQKKEPSGLQSLVLGLNRLIGSASSVNMLALPFAALLWAFRLRVEAVITMLMCWIGGLTQHFIKQAIDRPRPSPLVIRVTKSARGKSFPSGDVAASVMLWGWLLCIGIWKRRELSRRQVALLSLPASSIAFIGPARVYLGDHWTTDVLGGYLFGGGWLSLTLYLYRRLGRRYGE